MSLLQGWFHQPGAYVLVDGQFGSTGKGLLAAFLAVVSEGRINVVTTNAGPNSGHTAYWRHASATNEEGYADEEIMTQQLPVASVILDRMNCAVTTYLNAGAVIDPVILNREAEKYAIGNFIVHPNAALITPFDRKMDEAVSARIAGTGKGVGPAIVGKVMRQTEAIASRVYAPILPEGRRSWDDFWRDDDVVLVETAQGYSLGINSSRFYPHTTSRECTVQQAIADARIPINMVRRVIACFRTFPIRVGNTQGSSGGCYGDQEETTWGAIGQTPELTTVTKRVRRVFTWSRTQFRECLATNRPDALFINFVQYMDLADFDRLYVSIIKDYRDVMGHDPEDVLLGYGPHIQDIKSAYGEI